MEIDVPKAELREDMLVYPWKVEAHEQRDVIVMLEEGLVHHCVLGVQPTRILHVQRNIPGDRDLACSRGFASFNNSHGRVFIAKGETGNEVDFPKMSLPKKEVLSEEDIFVD